MLAFRLAPRRAFRRVRLCFVWSLARDPVLIVSPRHVCSGGVGAEVAVMGEIFSEIQKLGDDSVPIRFRQVPEHGVERL